MFKELVSPEDLDDVIPIISRQYVMHSLKSLHEVQKILYRDDQGKYMALAIRSLRIENGTTVIALLSIVNVDDMHAAFARKDCRIKEISNN